MELSSFPQRFRIREAQRAGELATVAGDSRIQSGGQKFDTRVIAEQRIVGNKRGMPWWSLVVLGVLAVLFAVWWPMRDYVRIRRKDCCGKGCGCLFPVKPKKP